MSSERLQKRIEMRRLKREEKKEKERIKKLKERRKKKAKEKKKIKKLEQLEKTKPLKKKRVGRPKKRGPKKKRCRKKVIKIVKPRPLYSFKIVSVMNGKQNGYVGQYYTYEDAFEKLSQLEKENNNVVFPRKYLNNEIITSLKDEYLLLEKNRDGVNKNILLKNDFGKFVEHQISNNDKWIIRNKTIRYVEETFWVYGYDPKIDRKNFSWIYENIILGKIKTPYDIIRILVYKNKLIIKYDNNEIGLVICKNKSDSIRMYNLISETNRKEKNKQIVCVGALNNVSDARRDLENELIKLTGWTKAKIQRSTT